MKLLCRRRGFTLVELLVLLVVVCIMVAIIMPPRHGSLENARRAACRNNLKQIGLAFIQYSQDYDDRWPRIAVHAVASSVAPFERPYGWADALQPYIKSTELFQCPSEPQTDAGIDAVQPAFTDYYFNTNASGIASKYFDVPSTTLLSGDGNDGKDLTNARYNRKSLPNSWRVDENSPARRHLDTANYLFVDGHVKSIISNRVQNTASPSRGKPTFAIR